MPYGEASFDTYAHFSIVPNPTEGEGGAMIELRTVREAQRARKGLSGLNFADTELRVGWPSDYVPLTEEEVKKCMATAVLGVDGACVCVCVCVCFMCVYIYTHTHTHYIYIYMYICIYTYTYIYIYTHTLIPRPYSCTLNMKPYSYALHPKP